MVGHIQGGREAQISTTPSQDSSGHGCADEGLRRIAKANHLDPDKIGWTTEGDGGRPRAAFMKGPGISPILRKKSQHQIVGWDWVNPAGRQAGDRENQGKRQEMKFGLSGVPAADGRGR